MNPNGSKDRSFEIPLSNTEVVDIRIHVPALRAQGLDLTPWASTYVLASLLHQLDIQPPAVTAENVPILELGAGIGLVGLAGSMIWHRPVVMTDLGPIVPGLATNIQLNSELLSKHRGSAAAGALDWNKPEDLIIHHPDGTQIKAEQEKASIILAADTVYSEDHPPMLAQTILKWLAPGPNSRAIITYPLRVAYLDQIRELWELLEGGGLEAMREGQERAAEVGTDSWDDERLCEWSVWRWRNI